jgi:hypothetical protein
VSVSEFVSLGLSNGAVGWCLLLTHRLVCSSAQLCEMLERENTTRPTQLKKQNKKKAKPVCSELVVCRVLALVATWVSRLGAKEAKSALLHLLGEMSGEGGATGGAQAAASRLLREVGARRIEENGRELNCDLKCE